MNKLKNIIKTLALLASGLLFVIACSSGGDGDNVDGSGNGNGDGNGTAAAPSSPKSFAPNAGDGYVYLKWESAGEGASYKVYMATEPFGSKAVSEYSSLAGYNSFTTDDTSYQVTGLTNGTTYYFVVTTIKDGKESAAGDEIVVTPEAGKPRPPTSLTGTVGDAVADLSWTATGESGVTYKVHWATVDLRSTPVAEFSSLAGYNSAATDDTSYQVTGLTNGTTYYFVVTADNGKDSSASNQYSATPAVYIPVPKDPTGLTQVGVGNTVADLSWTATGESGVTYRLHRSTQQFDATEVIDFPTLDDYHVYPNISTTSHQATGLTNGTTYYFVVTAYNGKNSGASNQVSAEPVPRAPILTKNSILSTKDIDSNTMISLSWTAAAGTGVTYRVHQASVSFRDTDVPYYPWIPGYKEVANTTATSYQITGLDPIKDGGRLQKNGKRGGPYYFVVTAYNANDSVRVESKRSNEVILPVPTWHEVKVISDSTWSARSGHAGLVFDDKMWVLGGWNGTDYYDDVWHSTDGKNWHEVTASGDKWSARSGHVSLVYDDKMWVLGGWNGTDYYDDVWYSTDGASWNEVTASGNKWTPRSDHAAVVFDDKMWVLGGKNDSAYNNEVWYSTDGAGWDKVTIRNTVSGKDPWSERSSHAAVVFDDEMWVLGGYNGTKYLNDIWLLTDSSGESWSNKPAGWRSTHGDVHTNRTFQDHAAVVYNDWAWILGAYELWSGDYKKQVNVYLETIGDDEKLKWGERKWDVYTGVNISWSARQGHAAVVFNNQIWVLGGNELIKDDDSVYKNDVWRYGQTEPEEPEATPYKL